MMVSSNTGKMLNANEEGARVIPEHRVACLTTNSLKEILKLFPKEGENWIYLITRLKARASNLQADTPLVDDETYGITGYLDRRSDSFDMDYELKFDEDGNPINPIDRAAIRTIEDDMRKVGIEDAAVEYLWVLLRDPQIKELTGAPEDLFHFYIQSDPVDGDVDREKITEHAVNEALIKECGFKYRILHCRRLIDRRSELTLPKSQLTPKYIILWTGETVYSLRSPIVVAQHLKDTHFGEYKLIKRYGVGVEDTLVLLSAER